MGKKKKGKTDTGAWVQISRMMKDDFGGWGITNYGNGYAHLAKGGAKVATAPDKKDADARLYMGCHAFNGNMKTTSAVKRTGGMAFRNGAGCCTTSAFAVAFQLLECGIRDRIEIIGQGSHDNGHMWVVIGRTGGTVRDGKVNRPANPQSEWGEYIVCDVWLKAFGWPGVWKTPPGGKHHFFIEDDHERLEITYDSTAQEED
jgi:hypothetical protein